MQYLAATADRRWLDQRASNGHTPQAPPEGRFGLNPVDIADRRSRCVLQNKNMDQVTLTGSQRIARNPASARHISEHKALMIRPNACNTVPSTSMADGNCALPTTWGLRCNLSANRYIVGVKVGSSLSTVAPAAHCRFGLGQRNITSANLHKLDSQANTNRPVPSLEPYTCRPPLSGKIGMAIMR